MTATGRGDGAPAPRTPSDTTAAEPGLPDEHPPPPGVHGGAAEEMFQLYYAWRQEALRGERFESDDGADPQGTLP